jgi:hypothetical protein
VQPMKRAVPRWVGFIFRMAVERAANLGRISMWLGNPCEEFTELHGQKPFNEKWSGPTPND